MEDIKEATPLDTRHLASDATEEVSTGKVAEAPAFDVDADAERCPACPDGGAPVPPLMSPSDNEPPALVWIACTRCSDWYHTFCVIASRSKLEGQSVSLNDTLPERTKSDAASHERGDWWDWSGNIDKWFCAQCISQASNPSNPRPPRHPLVATLKASPSVGSKRRSTAAAAVVSADGSNKRPKRQVTMNPPDYRALHNHEATPTSKWLELISNPAKSRRVISDRPFKSIPGSQLTKKWIESPESNGLFFGPNREPIIVTKDDGGFESMGGKLPGANFDVGDVAKLVGETRMVDVIDVATQSSSQWTLEKWADYVKASSSGEGLEEGEKLGQSNGKVFNVISLEISGTELARKVKPPTIVREIDWVDNFWNFGPGGKGNDSNENIKDVKGKDAMNWPKVQLYCLMGMRGSWTDWHIDFAASSVYYTVHTGAKTFFFIKPTPENLTEYQKWSGSMENQQNEWLGDNCDEVRKVTLNAGDTMIIPSGYIHAVYTPKDSIVFGGNFLHSYNIESQLRVREIEIETKVPQRFRYPFFDRLAWFVAERFTSDLRTLRLYKPSKAPRAPCLIHPRILSGLVALADFLISQCDILEHSEPEDKIRKLVWDRVPSDKVPDPIGLAHELKWRVQRELGGGVSSESLKTEVKTNGDSQAKKARTFLPLDRQSRLRQLDYSHGEWQSEELPERTTTTTVMQTRPLSSSASPEPDSVGEAAVQTVTIQSQVRRRVLSQSSTTVSQEQQVVFTTTQTIWEGEN